MKVTRLEVVNFKAFEDAQIDLAPVTLLVGPNNSGKSILINALLALQTSDFQRHDVRLGAEVLQVHVKLHDVTERHFPGANISAMLGPEQTDGTIQVTYRPDYGTSYNLLNRTGGTWNIQQIPATEPNNFIYPYLSDRRVTTFSEDVNENSVRSVERNLFNLVAKIDRLSKPQYPAYREFHQACMDVLHLDITSFVRGSGHQAGIMVDLHQSIPLQAMGTGVASTVGLLHMLCVADGALFLLEEPENDIHPKALKALLHLIGEKAAFNQFVVSTHSNIVLRHLGALPDAVVYRTAPQSPAALPPTSGVFPVSTREERTQALTELGYELYDFDLWEGWLFLEESTAERVIRDVLIPWFAPGLRRIRTMETKGNARIEPAFEDFNRLFLFTHLEHRYRNRAWVLVDGDEEGRHIVKRLRDRYCGGGWSDENFGCFSASRFEDYYPPEFDRRVETVLAIEDRQQRKSAKGQLAVEVVEWALANREQAEPSLRNSSHDVIERLKSIEGALFPEH